MKIEQEPVELLDNTLPKKKGAPKINKKPARATYEPAEDSKVQATPNRYPDEYEPTGLGPAKAWDKVKDQFLPYNIRNYQDRLV
jgi:hypothetical protein